MLAPPATRSAPLADSLVHRLRIIAGLAVLLGGVAGCADPPPPSEDVALDEGDETRPLCPDGLTVGEGGDCTIPTIGKGEDVETPDGEFVPPELDNSDIEEGRQFYLTQEGDGLIELFVNETRQIGVRALTNAGFPAVGHRVDFVIEELANTNPSNAQLSSRTAVTNEFGAAHVIVSAGPQPSYFRVRMTANETAGLAYDVSVTFRPEVEPPGVGDREPPGDLPGGPLGGGSCMEAKGAYQVTNLYEPGRFLGDGIFNTLETIHRLLSDPGGFVGDLIRDRIGGVWGSIIRGAVRPVINYLYEYVVQNYAPDWVRWMLILTEDIAALLVQLEVQGVIEFQTPNPNGCEMAGSHRWETLVFIWRAGCDAGDAQCGRFPIPLNQLGLNGGSAAFDAVQTRNLGPVAEVSIGEHQLQLNLAVAVLWFVQNVILPARLNVNSFGELLQLVLPCQAVGQLAADYVGGSVLGFAVAPFVEAACEAGMEAAGNQIARMLTDALRVDAFVVEGTCKLRDQDGSRHADRIEEGRWTRGLPGDFSGDRIR